MVTVWGVAFMVLLLGFTGLAVDVWHIWEAKRDLDAVADAAANAGAGAVDEEWFRDWNEVGLDRDLARDYANASIDAQGDLPTLTGRTITLGLLNPPRRIFVTVETEVDLTLMRLFTGTDTIELTSKATGIPFRSPPCGDPVCTTPTTVP